VVVSLARCRELLRNADLSDADLARLRNELVGIAEIVRL